MNIHEQTTEYLDALVSIELAAALARKFNEPENRAIKNCITSVLGRLKDRRNYLIFQGLRKQTFPAGALSMLRRKLDEVLSA